MKYTQQEIEFAHYIAGALNDQGSLSQHLKFVRLLPQEFLLGKLEYVLSRPDHTITTSRAAYYNHLVNPHAQSKSARN